MQYKIHINAATAEHREKTTGDRREQTLAFLKQLVQSHIISILYVLEAPVGFC